MERHSVVSHRRLSIAKVLQIVLVTYASIFMFPPNATGLECPQHSNPEWWFATADLVFEGRVIRKELVTLDDCPECAKDVTFGDLRVYKGDSDVISNLTITVRTGLFGDNGYPFICGEEYVVYAKESLKSGTYFTNICPPNRPLSNELQLGELEAVILEETMSVIGGKASDISESRKAEVREKYYQTCPEWQPPPVDMKWRFQMDSFLSTVPVIAGEVIIFGSRDGYLYALNNESGASAWKFKPVGVVHHSPVVVNGVAYFGTNRGHFYAVDVFSGKELWNFKAHDMLTSSSVVSDGVAYFGSNDGFFYAVDITSGKKRWKYKAGGRVNYPPVIFDETIYFGSLDNYLYALDITSGKEIWEFKAHKAAYAPRLINNKLYFLSGMFSIKYLYAVDVEKNIKLWEFDFEESVGSSFFMKHGRLYLFDSTGYIRVVDAETGKEHSRINTNINLGHSPIDDDMAIGDDGILYVGDDTYLYAVDILTGEHKWQLRATYGDPYLITINDQSIYFGNWHYLYAFTKDK